MISSASREIEVLFKRRWDKNWLYFLIKRSRPCKQQKSLTI